MQVTPQPPGQEVADRIRTKKAISNLFIKEEFLFFLVLHLRSI